MKMIIDGRECSALSGEEIQVLNPYNGVLVDTVPNAGAADIDRAVEAAQKAQREWKKVPVYQKTEIVKKFLLLVEDEKENLARTLSMESGKNITEAKIEIRNIFTSWNAFSEKAKHLYGSLIPNGMETGHDHNIVLTKREALGVIACILPFNFPCNMFNQKVAPAILSGNAVIIKPASDNPLTILKLTGLLQKAGVPAGVVQAVTGYGGTTGTLLAEHPGIQGLSLTGSVKVGKTVARTAADTLKTVVLELGGNDAFIVLKDADLDLAVTEAINGRFFNAGQICCAPKRFLIHRSLYTQFIEKVTEKAAALKCGDPLDPGTKVGTLINEKAARTVEEQINRTKEQGGRLILGGHRENCFISPTIFSDVPYEADIMHNVEVFGPVMPVACFDEEEEAIKLANDTSYGLGGSVFTKDLKKAARFSEELECGSVVINGSSYFRSFEMPFGGLKQSGIGAEGVATTFDEFTTVKCISLKGIV